MAEGPRYDTARVARELEQTALGHSYYGNALRVAKDMPGVTPQDRSLLDRYATGGARGTDHVALQDLARRLRSTQAPDMGAPDPAAALRAVMRMCDAAKQPCSDDPESPAAIRNGAFASIALVAAQGLGIVRGPDPDLAALPDDVMHALDLASRINPYGSVENAQARDAARAALERFGGVQQDADAQIDALIRRMYERALGAGALSAFEFGRLGQADVGLDDPGAYDTDPMVNGHPFEYVRLAMASMSATDYATLVRYMLPQHLAALETDALLRQDYICAFFGASLSQLDSADVESLEREFGDRSGRLDPAFVEHLRWHEYLDSMFRFGAREGRAFCERALPQEVTQPAARQRG